VDMWKQAEVVPILQVKFPSKCKEYRRISLLFHLGKVLEQVIIPKLSNHLSRVTGTTQYAYQQKLSTTDALLKLVDDWMKN